MRNRDPAPTFALTLSIAVLLGVAGCGTGGGVGATDSSVPGGGNSSQSSAADATEEGSLSFTDVSEGVSAVDSNVEAQRSYAAPSASVTAPASSSKEIPPAVKNDELYGLCLEIYPSSLAAGYDYKKAVDAMRDLGVGSFRMWLHSDYLMTSPIAYSSVLSAYKQVASYAADRGIEIVGMNHRWFSGISDAMAVPARNTSAGSGYQNFLADYETTWYNLVRQFLGVTLWEIGNEWNNDVFLYHDTALSFQKAPEP